MPVLQTGPRNLITDVAGLAVGNAGDMAVRSGVTVILPDTRVTAAVDARGGGTGTRELTLLDPDAAMDRIDALVLSGGSAFGLDAAGGVMAWLAARDRGFRVGAATVPIVPQAILFDLLNGGDKGWGFDAPYWGLAVRACDRAGSDFALGNAGAGLGATAGALKGGLGSASITDAALGVTVGALAAVNAAGSVLVPGTPTFHAWSVERDGEFGAVPPAPRPDPDALDLPPDRPAGASTTLGVVATDARLGKAEARRLAIMAQDGLARAIRPAHTPLDGDTVFALATGAVAVEPDRAGLARIGALAADCLARAIARGVYEAESLGDIPSYRARHRRPWPA